MVQPKWGTHILLEDLGPIKWCRLTQPSKKRGLFCRVLLVSYKKSCFPRHPKSSKYLVSRCLEPLKAKHQETFGVSNTDPHQVFGRLGFVQVSHEKKALLLSIESWLVNRDPYNGLLKSLYTWVV